MKKVVIIDNNADIVGQVVIALKEIKEIEIIGTATNGKDGLLLVRRTRPDIVITDIKMPEIEGTELIEIIAKNEENYVPHFIVITSQDAQNIVQLRELPIRKLIPKPFVMNELIDEIIKIQKEERVKIIIADDDVKFCNELRGMLVKYEDIEVLGVANTDEDEISMIENLKPDIVITDILRNGELSGEKIIEQYLKDNKLQKFLVISYSPFAVSPLTYKNVVCSMHKFEIEKEIDKLVFKLRKTKKDIVRKRVDTICGKSEPIKGKASSSIFYKIKEIFKF